MAHREDKKVLRTLTVASFLNDFGSDIVYPIWPMFVTSVLGANMAVLGFIDGLGEAIVSLSSAGSGYLSDRLRRRKVFIWLGYLMGTVSRLGYALATTWQHLVPLRALDRLGKIRSAPRDAIIADISTDANRGRNFGLLRAMDNLGAVGGILVCIFFFDLGFRTLFLLAAFPSAIAVVLVLLVIREPSRAGVHTFKGLSFSDLDANFWLFLVLSSFFTLGSFSYSFLLLYAKKFGVAQSFVPVLYLIFTAVAAVFSIPFGKLADRVNRRFVLFVSYVLWGVVCIMFLAARSYAGMILSFFVYGLHKASLDTVQRTFAAELAPVQFRASTLGGFQLVLGLCALPSSFVAGLLWEKIDFIAPLYVSFGLTILSCIMLLFVRERQRVGGSPS